MSASHRRRSLALRARFPLRYSRREFLRRSALAGAAALSLPALTACGNSRSGGAAAAPVSGRTVAFLHGVASGDPLTDRVILWTRVTPEAGSLAPVAVDWVVSLAPDLSAPVASGRVLTDGERDFTVKIDPAGLASFTTYYYQFSVAAPDGSAQRSPIGRTRTAPAASDAVSQIRIAAAACNNYTFGLFNAFGRIGERADLDLVLHLGDYLYEGGNGQGDLRAHTPDREILTLADYRERHAQYKTDPDLQEAHRQHPWITTWDDHESTNNSFASGADNHTEGEEGCWAERVGWAIRAYFEWMPIRDRGAPDAPDAALCPEAPPATGLRPDGSGRIYRKVAYGEQLDLFVLDTRLVGRAPIQGTSLVSPEQTILGAEQRDWLLRELPASTATWKLVLSGTTFAPLITPGGNPTTGCTSTPGSEPCYLNEDAWDGYRFDRNAVFDVLEQAQVQNTVFVFGDIHAVIACDLPRVPNDPLAYNPLTGEGSLGVELCCGGVAQVPLPIWNALRASGSNPHMKHVNETQLGYQLMDLTAERLQSEWYYSVVQVASTAESRDPVMLETLSGSQRLTVATSASPGKDNPPPLAP
ncbi:MAG TPA: alkaline phosphatase D family protein [Nevskiaceae bacterium]|nr:alkaline phosphatase D family protein [Nevskiaceae bacterium]